MRFAIQTFRRWFPVFALVAVNASVSSADVVTFGSKSNTFTLTFEAVEDPGNAADSTGYGAVDYSFGMSRYEITERMIDVYNADSRNALFPIAYDAVGRGPNMPATSITWNEAARFVNWLNVSKGYAPAYYFPNANGSNLVPWTMGQPDDYQQPNRYRSKRAVYVLPSIDEWYKAAYYEQSLNGGAGGYWKYSVQMNSAPNSVLSGTGPGDVVYGHGVEGSPADVESAGGLSSYGVMAMNGNAGEWTETPKNRSYISGSTTRAVTGGSWAYMSAADFGREEVLYYSPTLSVSQGGFRVVSLVDFTSGGGAFAPLGDTAVPEPGICVLCGTLSLAAACRKTFRKRK
jgi:formylglycine-generating enzyme required for sulfatase activity